MIDRSGQIWLSEKIGTYRYVFRSYEGVWMDGSVCVWHEFINLMKGLHGRAREQRDGSWEVRQHWKRLL